MITTYVTVAILIGLVLLARRPFARAFGAKAAYALWALPLARLVMPPLPAPLSPMGWLSAQATPEPGGLAASQPAVALPSDGSLVAPPGAPMPALATPGLDATGGSEPSAIASALADPANLLAATAAIIAAGALFLMARQAFAQWRFAWLIRHDSEPASPGLAALSEEVQVRVGLKRRADVRTSFLCGAPLVTGVLRPTILVPAWFELDYTEDERRIALTHEAMHVRRGDLLALQLAHLVAVIQWINPIAWRALDAFRADQEAACDADVLALKMTSPRAYGATLLKAIRLSRPGSAPAFAAALPLNHSIKERFAMLQCDEPSPKRKRVALSLSLTAGAAALLATATAQETELRGGPDSPGEKSETAITRIITNKHGRSRELVIVTDPMQKVEAHLSRLDELEWPEPPQPPAYPSAPQPPLPDLSMLEELEGLEGLEALADIVALASDGSSLSLNGGHVVITGKDGQRMAFSLNQEEVENFTAMIERRAEAFEARMEEWAANLEDSFEVNFEIDMERFEAEISRVEAEVEAITESPEFEALVERGTRSIEDLHEACDEKDLGDVGVAVVTSREGDKAICIDGEADREVVESAIRKEVDLSEAEKQRLLSVIER